MPEQNGDDDKGSEMGGSPCQLQSTSYLRGMEDRLLGLRFYGMGSQFRQARPDHLHDAYSCDEHQQGPTTKR